MLRSPDGRDPRHITPLPDNKHDTSPQGSKDSTPPIRETEAVAQSGGNLGSEPLPANNALQESAYRLHALVKRSSPQKLSRSPIRFNKTEPLPSIGKPLHPSGKVAGGSVIGGISKAPPSPRRSPLRRDASRDTLSGTPQTRNVVERMIAYARHAASQEDPSLARRDRQNFVSRLADGAGGGRPDALGQGTLGESPLLKTSPQVASQSTGPFPIMSNLSVHANLRKQQTSHTAPLKLQDAEAGRRLRPTTRAPNYDGTQSSVPDLALKSAERPDDYHTTARLDDAMFDPLTVDLNAVSPSPSSAPLPSSTSAASYSNPRLDDRPRREHDVGQSGGRRPAAHHHEDSASAAPSTPQRKNALSAPLRVSSEDVARSRHQEARTSARSASAAATQWDKEKWRVFIQAVRDSFGVSSVTPKDAVDVFNELICRLPPDLRGMTVQEMVHRLNAWMRSTTKLAKQ